MLCREVEARGGVAIKLDPTGRIGLPDRLVILPGRLVFVEVKRPKGGVIAPHQAYWLRWLSSHGHAVRVIDTPESVVELVKELTT